MAKSLGFLLALAGEDARVGRALAFLESEHQREPSTTLYVFAVSDGVRVLEDAALQSLRQSGVRVLACAQSAVQRGIAPGQQATFGGLGLLSDLLVGADRFLALGPGSPSDWPPAPHEEPVPSTEEASSGREVVVSILNPDATGDTIIEAVRVAAGLQAAAGSTLAISLAVCPGARRMLDELSETGEHPGLKENLRQFTEAGGQALVRGKAAALSFVEETSLRKGVLYHPQTGPGWNSRLARAFVVLPF